jgi:hypothetical protein
MFEQVCSIQKFFRTVPSTAISIGIRKKIHHVEKYVGAIKHTIVIALESKIFSTYNIQHDVAVLICTVAVHISPSLDVEWSSFKVPSVILTCKVIEIVTYKHLITGRRDYIL